jgi:hypothetical protein
VGSVSKVAEAICAATRSMSTAQKVGTTNINQCLRRPWVVKKKGGVSSENPSPLKGRFAASPPARSSVVTHTHLQTHPQHPGLTVLPHNSGILLKGGS